MCDRYLYATLVVLALVLIAAMFYFGDFRGRPGGEGYLVYPYLDLDTPGERGSYYAMSEPPCQA